MGAYGGGTSPAAVLSSMFGVCPHRRIVFSTMIKKLSSGTGGTQIQEAEIPISLIKQIAGRAGRRNSAYPEGWATTLHETDMARLQEAIQTPISSLNTPAAGLVSTHVVCPAI